MMDVRDAGDEVGGEEGEGEWIGVTMEVVVEMPIEDVELLRARLERARFLLLGVPDAFGSLCVDRMCSIKASPFRQIL